MFVVVVFMFFMFEYLVDFFYGNIIYKFKNECLMGVQFGVICMVGYMFGVVGIIIFNLVDNMIIVINKRKGFFYVQV